ncbi:MAG: DNA internalization-related competence protein ComEC/Rec2, partial [Microbacteriaceae bacterium]|nr:DNA internalization-related competence protein ComEC/Rec2 [Burkholderiaceae bacterium]
MLHRRLSAQAWHWTLPALGWLGGLALLQQCRRLPSEAEFAAVIVALVAALVWGLRRPHPLAWAVVALLLAFAQGAYRSEARLAEALPEAWEARDLLLEGRVDSLPSAVLGQGGSPGWRFEFALDAARDPAGAAPLVLPRHLLLSWYAQPGEDAPALRAGERWRLTARLKRPHGLMNPHAFDYELWMFEQDLRATGVVRPGAIVGQARLAEAPWWSLDGLRQRLREALQKRVADPSSAGLLAALSLGDQAAISRSDWALFRNTGIAHLVSISGLHVTMFAWGAQALVGWLWRRGGRLSLWVPTPLAARWMGVLAALMYALFSGWGVSSQRTVWRLFSIAALKSVGLRWPWPLSLLAACVIVTAVDPWAISQAGFWLSFAAVGLLMASGEEAPGRQGFKAHLKQGLRSQWVATLGLAPLSLLFFQQISVVGLLANWVAIPWVSFVVTPLALGGALLPGLWVWAEWCARALMACLRLLDGLPWAVWSLPVAPLWAQLAGLIGGALLVLPLPWRLRACGLGLLLPLLWPAPLRPGAGEFELLAADIGQGTAVLVRTAGHDLLYDSGPQYAPGADAGLRVLLPLLRAVGVDRLDALMLSHRDSDHVGGAASILAGLPVAALRSSLEPGHRLLIDSPPHSRCEAGQRWTWDGVQFDVLHPSAAGYERGLKSNALPCLLRISTAAGRSALLTGDIEAPQELALVAGMDAASLRSSVLLVPHHGSKTSSTEALPEAVAPQIAVVQRGYRNRFGHPAPPVLARYQAQGIALVTSPDCGA